MSQKEKGNLTLTTSPNRQMIVSIGDDIKLLITRDSNSKRIKLVVEAPKDIRVSRLTSLERELNKALNT